MFERGIILIRKIVQQMGKRMSSTNVVKLFTEPPALGGRLPNRVERMRAWHQRRNELMTTAKWAEQWGYSWRPRPKRYGCAVLACRCAEREEDRFGIFLGWNCTFTERAKDASWPKPCAEPASDSMAADYGFDAPVGYVVYTNNIQPDDWSGITCTVQDPCRECQQRFLARQLPLWAPFISFRDRRPCDMDDPGDEHHVIRESVFADILRRHATQTGQR